MPSKLLQNKFGKIDNFGLSDVSQTDPQFNESTSEKLISAYFSDCTQDTSYENESEPRHSSKAKNEISPQQDDDCNLDDLFNMHYPDADADNESISKMLEPDDVSVSIKNNSIQKVVESKNSNFSDVDIIYQNNSPLDQSTNETQEKSYSKMNNAELELHMKSSGLHEFMTDIEWEPIWERFQTESNDEDKKIDEKIVDIQENHKDEKINDRPTEKARMEYVFDSSMLNNGIRPVQCSQHCSRNSVSRTQSPIAQ